MLVDSSLPKPIKHQIIPTVYDKLEKIHTGKHMCCFIVLYKRQLIGTIIFTPLKVKGISLKLSSVSRTIAMLDFLARPRRGDTRVKLAGEGLGKDVN